MDEQDSGTAVAEDRTPAAGYAPGERRDRRHSRTEWQRRQYRAAEPGPVCGDEARPHEPEAEAADA